MPETIQTEREHVRSCNPYEPKLAVVEKIIEESWDTKTFRAVFQDEALRDSFTYEPGQFQQVSVFGVGESTFCLTSSPTRKGYIEFAVKKFGSVTTALHELDEGAIVGVRAPLGNWFPYKDWKGKNLLFIGGGIGMAPMRALLNFCLDKKEDYGQITTIYGARTPGDLCFKYEFEEWNTKGKLYLTVDQGDDDWKDHVGHVPGYLKELAPSPDNTIAITCGPPIMIKFALVELANLGFTSEQIYTTLEMRMKCGIGKCGRCNIGSKFVCLDGPVFSYAEIKELPPEF
ncbi:MAG: FAD/NAD(P)-binding protein [Armatimonadetes bacterium]|nr:FAD/NAD(P)-binding protein [Armatimonadota bacterium]